MFYWSVARFVTYCSNYWRSQINATTENDSSMIFLLQQPLAWFSLFQISALVYIGIAYILVAVVVEFSPFAHGLGVSNAYLSFKYPRHENLRRSAAVHHRLRRIIHRNSRQMWIYRCAYKSFINACIEWYLFSPCSLSYCVI